MVDADKQIEYSALLDELDCNRVRQAAFANCVAFGGGVARIDFLVALSATAKKYAIESFSDGSDALEAMYFSRVCEAVGYLHDAYTQGWNYERVSDVADVEVARTLAHITPDWRQPQVRRHRLLANAVGLSPLHAKIVKLSALLLELPGVEEAVDSSPVAVIDWLAGARCVSDVFSFGKGSVLASPAIQLRRSIVRLEGDSRLRIRLA